MGEHAENETSEQRDESSAFDPARVYISPISAAELAAANRPVETPALWPTIIGLVSAVLGALTLPMYLGFFALPKLLGTWGDIASEQGIDLPPLAMTLEARAHALLRIALAIMLVVAGALTLFRKRAGAIVHIVYGLFGIGIGVWGIVLNVRLGEALAAWASAHQASVVSRFLDEPSVFGRIIAAAITLAWPALMLVWFGLLRKRPERQRQEAALKPISA